uniref:BHLH domain-containing protein n=1 Tax=Oryza glumipatula TaxID=40148 RepID=A0A0D9YIQ4_9ORYZ
MNRMTAPHGGMPPPPMPAAGGLARYGSAPGSLLASIADSVIRGGGVGVVDQLHHHQHQHQLPPPPPPQQQQMVGRYFSAESSGLTSCESSCRTTTTTSTAAAADVGRHPLERAYGGSGEIHVDASSAAVPLFRHSSSPAGLLSRLMADPHGNGMAATRGMGGYSGGGGDAGAMAHRRLSSQWSFSRQDLPQISEMGGLIPDIGESIVTGGGGNSSSDGAGHGAQSSSFLSSRNFSMSSWDDTNSIMFSPPSSSKKARVAAAAAGDHGDDMVSSFSNIDSQFGLSKQSSLEMAGMDDFLQLQPDSVACRARAKRGCATHPRSIAERERRTRISKRLKKLQDLVPNMDKQTNTSDMLDIAVTYIKELQGQVEKLKHDQANCTCSGKHDC